MIVPPLLVVQHGQKSHEKIEFLKIVITSDIEMLEAEFSQQNSGFGTSLLLTL